MKRRSSNLLLVVSLLIFLLKIVQALPDVAKEPEDYPEQRLADKLLRDYHPWARPCRNTTIPIEVKLQFSLMQINSLDEKSQVLTTTGWLSVRWHDDLLSWNPSEFGNLTTMEIPGNLVWVPIFGLDNHARSLYDPTFRTEFFVRASYNGSILWDVGNQFVSSCKLELFYYPWDYQACVLSFQSYSHGADKMKLVAGAHTINNEDFTTNGEWDIISFYTGAALKPVADTRACDELATYDVSNTEGFWTVHFEIHLHRKPKFYITHVITPVVVLSILVFIVFWLPPEAGEKVSLAMTILLSFSVFLLMIAENMPKTGDSVPLLAIYLASFMAASAISIVLSVWIIRSYYHDLNCRSRSTGRICRYFIRRFAFLVDIDAETVEAVLSANTCANKRHDHVSGQTSAASNDHPPLSPVKSILSGNYFEEVDRFIDSSLSDQANIADENSLLLETSFVANNQKQTVCLSRIANEIRAMSRNISVIRKLYETHQRRHDNDENCINEWRLFARVADRFILLVHVLFFLASIIYGSVVFSRAPQDSGQLRCMPDTALPDHEEMAKNSLTSSHDSP